MKRFRPHFRRGSSMIYVVVALIALIMLISLGVDFGRVQVAKTQLQAVADAAARYGVAGLQNDLNGNSAAYSNAAAVCAESKVDGTAVSIKASDVTIGFWKSSNRTFTPVTDVDDANAVKVTLARRQADGNAIPMTFARLLGRSSADISVQAIAIIKYGSSANAGAGNGRFDYYVPATSNPWLAGMANGSIANDDNPHGNPDYAGKAYTDDGKDKKTRATGTSGQGSSTQSGSNENNWAQWGSYASKKSSPINAGTIDIDPGTSITFDAINGGANNQNSTSTFTADGDSSWIGTNFGGTENGISNLKAPMNSLIAVFLDDNRPNTQGAAPAVLDFTTAASRDFLSLSPKLRQPFFVGDGRRSTGEIQKFVVPPGATRMFLCTMDEYEWNNNVGGFNVSAHVNGTIYLVK